MSVSRDEAAEATEAFCAAIGVRMTHAGRITIHFSQGGVFQHLEVNYVLKPQEPPPCRRDAPTSR